MASTQPNNFYFPHFPPPPSHPFSPPPPPSHSFKSPPPPPHSFAPLPPHGHPPPPPFHPFTSPPPHVRPPPPPHHPIAPPPPHVHPPPLPPSPSPNHPIVIVIVIVSLGGLGLLALLAFALFCCIQQRKKKTQETDIIHVNEHKKVEETTVPGPFGQQAVVISVENDVHIDEIRKTEKLGGLHAKSSSAEADQGNSSSLEVGTTSPGQVHHLSSNIKKRREKTPETDIIHIDEHTKVKENIVPNPFEQLAVAISVEDDVHIDEKIRKTEKIVHAKSSSDEADQGNSCSLEVEVGTTSPGHEHHHHH